MEIVSNHSARHDREEKHTEYEAAGVSEYWVVDPREGRERLDMFILDVAGTYAAVVPDAEGRLLSTVLAGLWVDPAWLTDDELPSVMRLATEMAGDGG